MNPIVMKFYTQQYIINPFDTMRPIGGSHFACHILISKYILLKTREIPSDVARKAHFNCIIFVFKESKTLRD